MNAVDTGSGRTTADDFLDDGCGIGDVNISDGGGGGGGGGDGGGDGGFVVLAVAAELAPDFYSCIYMRTSLQLGNINKLIKNNDE